MASNCAVHSGLMTFALAPQISLHESAYPAGVLLQPAAACRSQSAAHASPPVPPVSVFDPASVAAPELLLLQPRRSGSTRSIRAAFAMARIYTEVINEGSRRCGVLLNVTSPR